MAHKALLRAFLKSNTFSDIEVTVAINISKSTDLCTPAESILDQKMTKDICKYLKAHNYYKVDAGIEKALLANAEKPWCDFILKTALGYLCMSAPRIIKKVTFNLLGCH